MTTEIQRVILRQYRDGEVIALFPEEPTHEHGYEVSCYVHVGQHGSADYNWVISQTKPVRLWSDDAIALWDELKRIGYNPMLFQRRTEAMRREFRRRQHAYQQGDL